MRREPEAHPADSRVAGPALATDVADPLESMHRLVHRWRRLQLAGVRAKDDGLTPQELRVLDFFGRRPGATLSELAVHSGRDRGQLARVIAGLRERGWLKAEADALDGRLQRLSLSGSGLVLRAQLVRQEGNTRTQLMAGLSGAERSQLQALLLRLHGALDGIEAGDGAAPPGGAGTA